jgi:hypothetical protein
MEDLEERREIDYGKWIRWVVSIVVLGGIALVVGLALWPAKPASVYMEAAGARQVSVKMAAILRALSYNRDVTLDFQEAELNGFLAERAKVKRLNALSIDLKPGSFDLYAALAWAPPTNVSFLAKIKIPVTMRLSGSFQGGVLFVEKGRLGHLPLPGRTLEVSTGFFAKQFPDVLAEKRMIDALRTVAIDELRADLTLTPLTK